MLETPRTLSWSALLAALIVTVVPADPAKEDQQMLGFTHLYSDANGVSHFRAETLEFTSLSGPNVPRALSAYALQGAQGATFLRLAQGAVEDWHAAPRTQFLIIVQGESEVTAGDGQTRRFKPGDVVLMDDTRGKGHRTAAVGPQDHVALAIPVPAASAAPAG
jgi:quercetin dioxygenase-like cupin family protein